LIGWVWNHIGGSGNLSLLLKNVMKYPEGLEHFADLCPRHYALVEQNLSQESVVSLLKIILDLNLQCLEKLIRRDQSLLYRNYPKTLFTVICLYRFV
jgi:hypothetical protein